MNKLTVYKCLECGHYTISEYDGRSCTKCNGAISPLGDATYIDKLSNLTVDVSIKDTKIFKRMLHVFSALIDDKHTPDWIKDKVRRIVLEELNGEHDFDNSVICQNCRALLVDYKKNSEHIHLPAENVDLDNNGLVTLKCRCGCKTEYKINC